MEDLCVHRKECLSDKGEVIRGIQKSTEVR